jgi:hypothetical protein
LNQTYYILVYNATLHRYAGVFDPASLMQMMRRVHVAEADMCEYVLDWPSVYGCPLPAGRCKLNYVDP